MLSTVASARQGRRPSQAWMPSSRTNLPQPPCLLLKIYA